MSPHEDQLVGGKYRLREPLARGGMGTVWVARHVELDVDVAVKFRSSEQLDASLVDRFKREAQAAAQLKSPHVVQIHDYGVDEGVPYIAMELLHGEDLGDLLDREDRLSLRRTANLISQAAKGLGAAHAAGIVHRDIKPRNLFLSRQGSDEILKILDFGIAKRTLAEGDDGTTSANVILGSPSYMSPEQARGLELDRASDVWSLAAVAYRALTGAPPFVGESSQDTVVKICSEQAPAPSQLCPDLPKELDDLFERALARDRELRFDSAAALARALAALSTEHQTRTVAPRNSQAVRGRSTPTETLASPVKASAAEPGGRSRWPLWGAALALALTAWALLARERPASTESPELATSPSTVATTTARAEATALGATAPAEQVQQSPAENSTADAPHEPKQPEPPPVPSARHSQVGTRKATRAPSRPAPEPEPEPTLDPVFGLPLPPDASSKR